MGRPRKPPGQRKTRVSWTIDDDVVYALEQEAALGRRSVSSCAELYITSDVALGPKARPGVGVTGEVATVGARDRPGVAGTGGPHYPENVPISSEVKATPMSARPQRTAMCEHRVPGGSYCRKCDT